MDTELLHKTLNEISPETLVEWYNLTQYNLQLYKRNWKTLMILFGCK